MKKRIILIMLLFIIPVFVNAHTDEFTEEMSTVKYYKTVTVYNGLSLLSNSNYNNSYTMEISESEYNHGNDNVVYGSTTIETNYKKMTTTILTNGSYYKYKVNLYWKNIPKVRSYDTISISHYESVKLRGSISFNQVYCTSSGCKTLTTYYRNEFNKGISATFKVPDGALTSLEQTFSYDVQKSVPDVTIVEQKAVGDYAHATSDISINNAQKFGLGLGGILFDSSVINYYDEINPAVVVWSGTW